MRMPTARGALMIGAAVGLLVSTTACGGSSGGGPASSATTPTTATTAAMTSTSAAAPTPSTAAPATSAAGPSGPAAVTARDWPTYHGTPDRGGRSTTMPPARGPLTVRHALKLDGAVYASPLVVGGLTIVATKNDSVYAFDQSYNQVWQRRLGSPSPAEERQCGNIDPLGITGTPVYDPSTGRVLLVAENGGSVRHQLYALELRTGAVAWSKVVDLPGVSARDMQQRGGLAIAHGRVWVPYGAQVGDCGNYKGRVVGVRLDGSGPAIYYSPPTKRGGGMWNPAGPTVDRGGNILVVSANGAAFPGDTYDHTNSVLEVNGSAQVLDSFAPSDWAANNQGDVGLGSQGVALVGTTWAVLGGKSGPVYVLRQGHLGGIGGQVSVSDICRSFGGAAVDGDVVYLPCTDGVRAVRVDDAGTLHVLWHASSSITGSPVIGGGRIWALDPGAGMLHALNPSSGATVAQVDVGPANRFATPALYGADVVVPTLAGIAVVATS